MRGINGLGFTVAEAIWKGTPVIGGICGGIRIQIEDGKNGFLVSTPEECAQRIVELMSDELLRKRMATEGKGTSSTGVPDPATAERLPGPDRGGGTRCLGRRAGVRFWVLGVGTPVLFTTH